MQTSENNAVPAMGMSVDASTMENGMVMNPATGILELVNALAPAAVAEVTPDNISELTNTPEFAGPSTPKPPM